MQKRMFRDRYGLTDLVLSGQKTQTRDVIKIQDERINHFIGWNLDYEFAEFGRAGEVPLRVCSKYYVGEMVAVAMSYKTIYEKVAKTWEYAEEYKREYEKLAGWNNKMFTNTKMPFATIKITNIRVEKLQDISDKDCLAEGVKRASLGFYVEGIKVRNWETESHRETASGCLKLFPYPRQAFAALIDKINSKGTWASNPYVWVYDFELVK